MYSRKDHAEGYLTLDNCMSPQRHTHLVSHNNSLSKDKFSIRLLRLLGENAELSDARTYNPRKQGEGCDPNRVVISWFHYVSGAPASF